jgi:hypothetical protein
MAKQQGTKLSLNLAEAIETSRIEVADAEIYGEIQQPLATTGLGQPHQAGAAEAERRGVAAIGQGDGGQHPWAGL